MLNRRKLLAAGAAAANARLARAAVSSLDLVASDGAPDAAGERQAKEGERAPTGEAARAEHQRRTLPQVADSAKRMDSYTVLRAYTGRATTVRVMSSRIAGIFVRSLTDTMSADNGGTIIVDRFGRRWMRQFGDSVEIEWFGAVGNGVANDTAAFLAFRAWALTVPVSNVVVVNCRAGGRYLVADPSWPSGIENLIVHGNRCQILNGSANDKQKMLLLPSFPFRYPDADWTMFSNVPNFRVNTTTIGLARVTTTVPADAANFVAGEMVAIMSFDQQFSGSIPPSMRFFEYAKVTAFDVSTGVVQLDRGLKYVHQADFPYVTNHGTDGRARIYKTEFYASFDINQTYNDIEFVRNAVFGNNVSEAVYCSGFNVVFNRCKAPWFLLSGAGTVTLNDCTETKDHLQGGGEIDKLVSRVLINSGMFFNRLTGATAVDSIEIHRAELLDGYNFNPKRVRFEDCSINGVAAKINESYSFTDSFEIVGGTHAVYPIASRASGLIRKATINGRSVVWAAGVLKIAFGGADTTAQFISGCYVGQTVHVGYLGSDSSYYPSGIQGQVTAIMGAAGIAHISIDFNSALAGTETLVLFNEPRSTTIVGANVAGAMVDATYLGLVRGKYVRRNWLMTSSESVSNVGASGRIKRIMVNVLRSYTGASPRNRLLTIASVAPGAYQSRLNLHVDLGTPGRREASISSYSGWTGAFGETAVATLPNGPLNTTAVGGFSLVGPPLAAASNTELPIVSIEIEFEDQFPH
jgi:hypothetical protein